MEGMSRREKLVEVLDQYEAAGQSIADLRNAAVEYKANGGEGIEGFLDEQLTLGNGEDVPANA